MSEEVSGRMSAGERRAVIERTSLLNIGANLLIAAVKIAAGLACSSLAIISEGINNASDAGTSVLTLAGTKLSGKHADAKHPFGYGRVEYLTSLVVSILICYTGAALLRESIGNILHPEQPSVSVIAIALVAVSAVIKFVMGMYTVRMGKKTGAAGLTAVGEDGRNDSFFSLVTIGVSVLYLVKGISLDAWAGVLFSVIILKAGLSTLIDTIRELLGRPGEKELAAALYKEIRGTKGVLFAIDMMLHNYGPDAWSGSVNVEMDHNLTVGEAYAILHDLQLSIMHRYKVTMVFGVYAVDNDDPELKALRSVIGAFVREHEHLRSYHALYLDHENRRLYCDFMADYSDFDWDAVRAEFTALMAEKYPGYDVELTIETEFV